MWGRGSYSMTKETSPTTTAKMDFLISGAETMGSHIMEKMDCYI